MTRTASLVLVLSLAAAPAFAQAATDQAGGKEPLSTAPSNVTTTDTRTVWSPQLPAPPVAEDAPPAAFVKAAQGAIASGRLGEAQEAIERAESRALDRSVKPSAADEPSQQSLVKQLADARQMLASGDRMGAQHKLEEALANPEATAKAD